MWKCEKCDECGNGRQYGRVVNLKIRLLKADSELNIEN
jgi:hypothetical protein